MTCAAAATPGDRAHPCTGIGEDIVDWWGVMTAPQPQLEAALHGRCVRSVCVYACVGARGVGGQGLFPAACSPALLCAAPARHNHQKPTLTSHTAQQTNQPTNQGLSNAAGQAHPGVPAAAGC
jgi:hypothetical protein